MKLCGITKPTPRVGSLIVPSSQSTNPPWGEMAMLSGRLSFGRFPGSTRPSTGGASKTKVSRIFFRFNTQTWPKPGPKVLDAPSRPWPPWVEVK